MSAIFSLASIDKAIFLNVAELCLKNLAFKAEGLIEFGLPPTFVDLLPKTDQGYILPLVVSRAIATGFHIQFNQIGYFQEPAYIFEKLEQYFAEKPKEIVQDIIKQLRREQEDWDSLAISLRASLIRAEILLHILNFPEARVWPNVKAEINEFCEAANDFGWR